LIYERRKQKQKGEIEISTTNTISGLGDSMMFSRHEEPSEMNGPTGNPAVRVGRFEWRAGF
jgi:hypothetical protein